MNQDNPKISVIVPLYNCEKTVKQCLDSICSLDYPNYEIIVIDDGSTDATPAICRSYSKIKHISVSNGGPSKARNLGAVEATGEIIAFTDGDCVVDRYWLRELLKGFSSHKVAGVGGNQISPRDETSLGLYIQEAFSMLGFATGYMQIPMEITEISHNPSCNSSYRKSIFFEIGGFDESLWPGEDVDLDLRISRNNYLLIRSPSALVSHYRPSSFLRLGNMMRRYGDSAYKLFKRYGIFRPLQTIPFATIILLVMMITGCYFFHFLAFVLILFPLLPLILLLRKTHNLKKSCMLLFVSVYIIVTWHLGYYQAFAQNQTDSDH